MLRRMIAHFVAFCAIAGLVFLFCAWHRPILPIYPASPSHFSAETVHRGAVIAAVGACAQCHTRQDGHIGAQFAGDYKINTPFGILYSPNITPDVKTGIGSWSLEAFKRAMRQGISRDGHHLYSVFPFSHFTKMTDQDIADLYAYLMTRPIIEQKPRKNEIYFPLNIRLLQAGWKLFFFRSGVYKPDRHEDPLWNRGAYLAEGLTHCGACHSPHNGRGTEISGHYYEGEEVGGWIAPPLNAYNPSPISWNEDALYNYLRTGNDPLHGVTAGAMSLVVHQTLGLLSDTDIHALAHYFASKMARSQSQEKKDKEVLSWAMTLSYQEVGRPLNSDEDARLYQITCAECHSNFGKKPLAERPELALNSALWLDEPTNLFQIMLRGITADEGQKNLVMPSFASALSDHDMARIAAYLRRTRTTRPPWQNLEQKAAQIRAQMQH